MVGQTGLRMAECFALSTMTHPSVQSYAVSTPPKGIVLQILLILGGRVPTPLEPLHMRAGFMSCRVQRL